MAHVAVSTLPESVMQTYDPHKNTTETTQGSPRKMNLRVLIMSLVAIVVLFAIVYMIYSGAQPNPT
jgi:predicted secreted protein